MKTIPLNPAWPQSWRESHVYDCLEVFENQKIDNLGYHYAYKSRQRRTLDLIKKHVAPGSKILDVAAAQGNFSLLLAEAGYDVTWNDLRSELIDYVKLKHERGKIEYLAGNCFEVCKGRTYDAVLITEIIEHVAHPDEFLALVGGLVRPGGHIILTTPSGEYFINRLPKFSEYATPEDFESVQFKPNSDGHIFLLYEEELIDLGRRAGLETIDISQHTNPLTNGHVKLHLLLPFIPEKVVEAVERGTQKLPTALRKKLHTNWAVAYRKK